MKTASLEETMKLLQMDTRLKRLLFTEAYECLSNNAALLLDEAKRRATSATIATFQALKLEAHGNLAMSFKRAMMHVNRDLKEHKGVLSDDTIHALGSVEAEADIVGNLNQPPRETE